MIVPLPPDPTPWPVKQAPREVNGVMFHPVEEGWTVIATTMTPIITINPFQHAIEAILSHEPDWTQVNTLCGLTGTVWYAYNDLFVHERCLVCQDMAS